MPRRPRIPTSYSLLRRRPVCVYSVGLSCGRSPVWASASMTRRALWLPCFARPQPNDSPDWPTFLTFAQRHFEGRSREVFAVVLHSRVPHRQAAQMLLLRRCCIRRVFQRPRLLWIIRRRKAQAEPLKSLGVVQFVGRLQRLVKERREVRSGHLRRDRHELTRRESDCAAVALIRQAHQIVEAPCSIGRALNASVEHPTKHVALHVVAHRAVAIAADARSSGGENTERRLLERLHESAGR